MSEYIKPTKEYPVFVVQNNYTGDELAGFYRDWEIKNRQNWVCGRTTATNLTDAINTLHNYIRYNQEMNPNTEFVIYMIDGRCDKYGLPIRTKCYSITVKQAKRFKIF